MGVRSGTDECEWFWDVVALRAAGVVRVLDVLGDLLDPVVRGGQTMKWTSGSI